MPRRGFVFAAYSHLNVLTFSSLTGGCSEGLDAFRFFFKQRQQMCLWSAKHSRVLFYFIQFLKKSSPWSQSRKTYGKGKRATYSPYKEKTVMVKKYTRKKRHLQEKEKKKGRNTCGCRAAILRISFAITHRERLQYPSIYKGRWRVGTLFACRRYA